MNKYIVSLLSIIFSLPAIAQVAWIEPEKPDVTKPIRIYVDISKATAAEAQFMKDNPDEPLYIWTWKPSETRADSLVNGTGDKPWKNSNDKLAMTKDASKGNTVWYYEMIPTEFYAVEATVVYSQGISLLVKPKDGGGYGDPDRKTEDINLVVTPPSVNRGIMYAIPQTIFSDHITTWIYDNPNEKKESMKNLTDGDVFMHVIATATDNNGATLAIEPSKFFRVHENPALQMKKRSDGRFSITMIPSRFFVIPAGYSLTSAEITVRKKNYQTNADQIDEKIKLEFGCK